MPPQSPPQEPDYNAAPAYTAQNIQILTGIEHIRRRPGMFIGDTGSRGLHYLVFEAVGCGVDEFRAGFGRRIDVELLHENGCRVRDEGRGLLVAIDAEREESSLEVLFTTFGPGHHQSTHVLLNALSARLEVEVQRDGKLWRQEYQRGEATTDLLAIHETPSTGTTIAFWPDPYIFKGNLRFDFDTIAGRLRELAFLNPGLTCSLTDQRETPPRSETCHFPEGVINFVRFLNRAEQPVHSEVISCPAEDGQEWEVAFQWTDSPDERLRSYVNSDFTRLGGTHVSGLRYAVTRTLLEYARNNGLAGERECPTGEDCHRGLTGVVALQVAEPQFSGATKERLNNPEAEGFVRATVGRQFAAYLEHHPDDARAIWGRVLAARDARLARGAARRRRTKK
jgi:DNA gyrase subunit B